MIGDARLEHSRLFIDQKDRERFLDRLADRVEQYNVRLYLFVCMTNHSHLVFETPEGNCSKFMHSLLTAYTVYYNLRHGRHGHLLDGRFKAKLVEGDHYLLALTRYVHLNPVHVGSIKNKPIEQKIAYLRDYTWSSYPSYIGRRKALDFVAYGPILAEMGGQRRERPKRYRQFVESGLAEEDEEIKSALKESPRSIGSDPFRAWIDDRYQALIQGRATAEDASFRHITEPVPVALILRTVAEILEVEVEALRQRRRNSPLRAVAARMLMRFGGQTQRQAAAHLNMGTGGAVSAQVRKLPERMAQDRRLRRKVSTIEQRLKRPQAGTGSGGHPTKY